jgi:hypothetical protein
VHAQRLEDARAQEDFEGHAGDPADQLAEHVGRDE